MNVKRASKDANMPKQSPEEYFMAKELISWTMVGYSHIMLRKGWTKQQTKIYVKRMFNSLFREICYSIDNTLHDNQEVKDITNEQ